MGYGCLWDFTVYSQLIRHVRLISGFCSSGYDFAIPSSRLHLTIQTLGVALGFVGNYALCGLSPQTDGMPVILKRARAECVLFFLGDDIIAYVFSYLLRGALPELLGTLGHYYALIIFNKYCFCTVLLCKLHSLVCA